MGELFTNPGQEFSVGELAERIAASHATVSREASRLVGAGLLRFRDEGRRRLLTANMSTAISGPLRELLSAVYGVPAVVREEFSHCDDDVFIFGSYAARWFGQAGHVPNDVDVLVVGDLEPGDAWQAAARASKRLGVEVIVVVRTPDEWQQDSSGFAAQIRSQPLLHAAGPGTAMPAASGDDERGAP